MKKRIFLTFAILILVVIVFLSLIPNKRILQVREDGIHVILTIKNSGKTLNIKSTIKNISNKKKTLYFNNSCQVGHAFRTSQNFQEYYRKSISPFDTATCRTAIEVVELAPNEEMTTISKYKEIKKHADESVKVWPYASQGHPIFSPLID